MSNSSKVRRRATARSTLSRAVRHKSGNMRIVCALAASGVALAGCGGTKPVPVAPLQLGDGITLGGRPALAGGMGEGVLIQFVEHGVFGVGVTLRNRSDRTIDVVDAIPQQPARSLVHYRATD